MSAKIEHQVPSLNSSLIGEIEEGIACFRGVPYASLDKRWTHSQTKHSLESPFDATNYGPRCPQGEGQVLVTGGVNDPVPGDDEFKCLNLNVAVPQEALKERTALPVMVWIHGGAFNYGANSVARYRPVQLSLLAKAQGNPVIVVQIQYRLGPLGFSASNDIRSGQSPSSTSSGHPDPNSTFGNFGFVDQIHALEWVRDHIHDFGGDPANVTAFGVSAGSASIHYHILTGSPLFDRAILMSGSAPTLGPLPTELYEKSWNNFLARTGGFEDLKTPEQRLEKARALTPQQVIAGFTSAPLGPMGDGVLLPQVWSYNSTQPPTRCKEIIIGDTHIEAIIMDGLISSIPQSKFSSIVQTSIPSTSSSFLDAFNFTPDMNKTAYRDAMRCFLSVGMFQYPNILVANSFPGKVYVYHFDEPSPYPGPTFGLPYHGQCALFVYQNGNKEYPAEAKSTSERMGRVWTAFAAGKTVPWEEYGVGRRCMRFGPQGEAEVVSLETDRVREYKWLPWVEENYESLKKLTRELTVRV
ncbi:alpha/beta-hydrolase [Hyaloscypha variabilis F]|uniref:Alpha/beta-hydrolase n=1 Tax=Hyaloscypha variabilis (strain UAMH 11265 / GT02V1 / F) TaxID=1149755 RepID=A0A2J6SAM6_HYAVF|nr:alpha/beta-hydrolase [Hyaloscypha variabilis F]